MDRKTYCDQLLRYVEELKPRPHNPYENIVYLREGMWKFDEDSVCIWAGPFPGNYAAWYLEDYTN